MIKYTLKRFHGEKLRMTKQCVHWYVVLSRNPKTCIRFFRGGMN